MDPDFASAVHKSTPYVSAQTVPQSGRVRSGRIWVAGTAMVLVLIVFLVYGYTLSSSSHPNITDALIRMTRLGSPVWGSAWYEPRLRRFQKAYYGPYPEFPAPDRLGFVYRTQSVTGASHSESTP